MRYLIILAILIFAQQPAKLPESNRTPESASSKISKQSNSTQSNDNPLPDRPNAATRAANGNENAAPSDEDIRIQRKLVLFTGLLVVAGFITAGVIFWQSWETRKAAQAAADTVETVKRQVGFMEQQTTAEISAASASQRSANALINSERAWILAEEITQIGPVATGILWFSVTIRNNGRTPGRIINAGIETLQIPEHGILPPDPAFDISEESVNFMLPPNGHVSFLNAGIPVGDFPAISQGAMTFYVYGFVDYLGIENEPRQTRFCYKYHVPGEFDPTPAQMYPALDVPTSYTECT